MAQPPSYALEHDPRFAELIAAARASLRESTEKHPRHRITTLEALREGRVLSWLVTQMPVEIRPTLRRIIADFDKETLPVPVWDVTRAATSENPAGTKTAPAAQSPFPQLAGCAAYSAPEGVMYLSAPLFRGRYSKFRVAMGEDGALWGAKQMHSDRDVSDEVTEPVSGHPLATLPMAIIVREVLMMKALATLLQPLRVLRRGQDVYVITPLLPTTLPKMLRGGFATMSGAGRYVGMQVAAAVAHCHKIGYVHADVKLDNVLCADDGTLALCDFAMATALGADKIAAAQRGTPHNCAPEIAAALPFDATIDVWSLGILLLEMHARADANPFAPSTAADAADRWAYARQQHQAFAAWRQQTLAQGPWDAPALQRAVAASNPWADFVRPCAVADAGLAMLVLRHMLAPQANERAAMDAVYSMLAQLPDGTFAWPSTRPRDRDRDAAVIGLNMLRGQAYAQQRT